MKGKHYYYYYFYSFVRKLNVPQIILKLHVAFKVFVRQILFSNYIPFCGDIILYFQFELLCCFDERSASF